MHSKVRKGRLAVAGLAAFATGLAVAPTGAGAASTKTSTTAGKATSYVVLFARGTTADQGSAAVRAAGGTVQQSVASIGYAIATSSSSDFATRAAAQPGVVGAARNRVIGYAPKAQRPSRQEVERLQAERKASAGEAGVPRTGKKATQAEPLSDLQWDMRAIGATPEGSYSVERGDKKVLVGIIDTGVDGSHPDIAPRFDRADSRNFTQDMPDIDGPCEHSSCVDAADEDDNEHGTHVASTIGSPINGLGIAGVAPDVTLVNIRAGQDSGYFFLEPTLKALTYAGDLGVDVVNMSFYTDPWLFNCLSNPADSPAEQAEQKVVREATQRALDYARNKGVLPVAAAGNEATDLGHPTSDSTSPDYPGGTERDRVIDNSDCISVPAESNGVVTVTSTGPSGRKAYYSNYGIEQADVAAPGGDVYDTADNRRSAAAGILAAYPEHLARESGSIDENGDPTTPFVVKDCSGGTCAYYQYLQGTSMASPHAAGVAALIVSRYGHNDRAHPGSLTLSAAETERRLLATATDTPCPAGGTYNYTRILPTGAVRTASATCEGSAARNGFYGDGIVNALAAVAAKR